MFPGATADRATAAYAVVGAPLDATASFRPGARFGPDRIRRFAAPFEAYDRRTDARFPDLGVHDAGDVRAWHDVPDYLDFLAGELRAIVRDGAVPLVLGGEHTVTYAGVDAVEPTTLVTLDAHLDLRDEYDGDRWSHACVVRRALDAGPVDRAVVLGARAGSRPEWDRAGRADVTAVVPDGVRDWLADPPDLGEAYLSVDVDAADPGVAPGTGTPEPFGLDSRTMRDAVRGLAPACAGFDVVEVTDRDDGQAASLAAKLLRAFVYAHAAAGSGGGSDRSNGW